MKGESCSAEHLECLRYHPNQRSITCRREKEEQMSEDAEIRVLHGSTKREIDTRRRMAEKLRRSPLPNDELIHNLGLYMTRQNLARLNFIQHIYELVLPVHGVVMEFGVRWGQNLALFSNLRGIHEPYNYNRRIIGFDTFAGFPHVAPEDAQSDLRPGDYGVVEGWIDDLKEILDYHESNAPISHKKKYELVQGDASLTLPTFLETNPATMVALAYFDFDIYQPTKDCLEALLPRLTRGSILAFDELNTPEFPGETVAVREVLGLSKYAIRRVPSSPLTSYLVID